MLALIVGGSLNLNGVHRAMIAAAALLILGGIVSFVGIRNPAHDKDAGDTPESGAPAVAPALPPDRPPRSSVQPRRSDSSRTRPSMERTCTAAISATGTEVPALSFTVLSLAADQLEEFARRPVLLNDPQRIVPPGRIGGARVDVAVVAAHLELGPPADRGELHLGAERALHDLGESR